MHVNAFSLEESFYSFSIFSSLIKQTETNSTYKSTLIWEKCTIAGNIKRLNVALRVVLLQKSWRFSFRRRSHWMLIGSWVMTPRRGAGPRLFQSWHYCFLRSDQCAKELGVKIESNLKLVQQCNDAANTANRMFGFIKRNFSFKNKDVILTLYNSLVRHT